MFKSLKSKVFLGDQGEWFWKLFFEGFLTRGVFGAWNNGDITQIYVIRNCKFCNFIIDFSSFIHTIMLLNVVN